MAWTVGCHISFISYRHKYINSVMSTFVRALILLSCPPSCLYWRCSTLSDNINFIFICFCFYESCGMYCLCNISLILQISYHIQYTTSHSKSQKHIKVTLLIQILSRWRNQTKPRFAKQKNLAWFAVVKHDAIKVSRYISALSQTGSTKLSSRHPIDPISASIVTLKNTTHNPFYESPPRASCDSCDDR